VIATLDVGDATLGDLGIRRMMIGRFRTARGFPVVVGRAELFDGRVVEVVLPPVGWPEGSLPPWGDAVRALLAASARGEA